LLVVGLAREAIERLFQHGAQIRARRGKARERQVPARVVRHGGGVVERVGVREDRRRERALLPAQAPVLLEPADVADLPERQGEACDALIALHARRSHESIVRYASTKKPLIVTLTGTDLYRDLPDSAEARESLELAERLIVLQDAALAELAPALRRKTRVVYQ